MPKVVDHEARRREIVDVVWRLIAAEGVQSATTRKIAEVAGCAHGALLYYFPSKDAMLTAAFQHIFDATNRRADEAAPDRRGLDGLRTLCLEIMPLDQNRLDEARLAITFWQQALSSPTMGEMHAGFVNRWRTEMTDRLKEARADHDIADTTDLATAVDELLSMLMGLQILAVMSPAETTADRQRGLIEAFFHRLRGD